jgi:hypothetical protein
MKIAVIILAVLLVLVLIPVIYFSPWIYFSFLMKRSYTNTYAIQNVATNKDIRVYNVGVEDKTKVILYTHNQ